GNIPGCAAGLAALGIMEDPGFFPTWLGKVDSFMGSLQSGLDEAGFPARVQHLGCNFYIYVGTREPIVEYQDFDRLDIQLARAFFLKCIENGVYFHTDFTVSAMHDAANLEYALGKIILAAREVRQNR
ncbi:MAG: hypothetical protein HGA28_03950, partial [Anaerolineaceae bacterium]|nr:hypothetical protein [Anaerolineaceae bacterium]